MNFAEWLDPSGHGLFILASYGITFAVLLVNVLAPLVQGRRLRRQLRDEIRARRSAR